MNTSHCPHRALKGRGSAPALCVEAASPGAGPRVWTRPLLQAMVRVTAHKAEEWTGSPWSQGPGDKHLAELGVSCQERLGVGVLLS